MPTKLYVKKSSLPMEAKIIKFIFFGNYFVGILGIMLSLETDIQLRMPFNSVLYYVLLFSVIVMYYTYAYSKPLQTHSSANPRSVWYIQHEVFVKYSHWLFLAVSIATGSLLFIRCDSNLLHLPLQYWLIVLRHVGVGNLLLRIASLFFF